MAEFATLHDPFMRQCLALAYQKQDLLLATILKQTSVAVDNPTLQTEMPAAQVEPAGSSTKERALQSDCTGKEPAIQSECTKGSNIGPAVESEMTKTSDKEAAFQNERIESIAEGQVVQTEPPESFSKGEGGDCSSIVGLQILRSEVSMDQGKTEVSALPETEMLVDRIQNIQEMESEGGKEDSLSEMEVVDEELAGVSI